MLGTDEAALVLRLNKQSRAKEAGPFTGYICIALHSLPDGQFWVFSESVPRQILLLGLLVIPGAARRKRVLQFDKKIRSVDLPHILQPPASEEPESIAKMYVNRRAWRDGANLKARIASWAFPREIPVRGRFFRTPSSITFRRRIFSDKRESISRCPKSPFSSKTQNWQILYSRKCSSGI